MLSILSLLTGRSGHEKETAAVRQSRDYDAAADNTRGTGAGRAGWLLWGGLLVIMISLYTAFEILAKTAPMKVP